MLVRWRGDRHSAGCCAAAEAVRCRHAVAAAAGDRSGLEAVAAGDRATSPRRSNIAVCDTCWLGASLGVRRHSTGGGTQCAVVSNAVAASADHRSGLEAVAAGDRATSPRRSNIAVLRRRRRRGNVAARSLGVRRVEASFASSVSFSGTAEAATRLARDRASGHGCVRR